MIIITFLAISTILLLSVELVVRRFKIKTEYSRKITHIVAALIAAVSPIFIELWIISISCIAFAILILISKRKTFFISIHNVTRKTYGEIYLPLGEGLAALAFAPWGIREFQYGVLVMGLADPMASFVGQAIGKHKITLFGYEKSLEGSFAFYICALVLTFAYVPVGLGLIILPLMLTFVEILLGDGLDNLALPLVGAVLLALVA